jgi:hypothetical protein
MDGKPQRMDKHLISTSKKINYQDRSSVMMDNKKKKSGASNTNDEVKSTSASIESYASKSIRAFYTPARLSEKGENQLNLAFLTAIINGGVSFNFVNDYYLSEWINLIKPSYFLP